MSGNESVGDATPDRTAFASCQSDIVQVPSTEQPPAADKERGRKALNGFVINRVESLV